MRVPKLSERLMAVVSLVTAGNTVCDVGCDHGFVPIYLVAAGISPHVIAMDVREGPLARARQHIAEYRLEAAIETRISDGLAEYEPGEAQTLILAGMGGPLMLRILEAYPEKTAGFRELVLQPQSEIALFRKRLRELGIAVTDERMVLEDGKYYPMMKAVPERVRAMPEAFRLTGAGEDTPVGLQDAYGAILLERKDPVLLQYLLRERRIIDDILLKKPDLENWQKQSELNAEALHILYTKGESLW